MHVLVVCPSRGRPDAASALRDTFIETRTTDETQLVFAVDADDPALEGYAQPERGLVLHVGPPLGAMGPALNAAAAALLASDPYIGVIGFVGDDHRFMSRAWDARILQALSERPGMAYGDDRNWGERLPTMWFVSRDVALAFGMSLPELKHLYIDNYWLELAGEAGCLSYLPDVVIDHMHPAHGKGKWDEGYARVNSEAMYSADGNAFVQWREGQKSKDVARLKELLAAKT